MKDPQTWNELLDAGYVRELTEEEIASFRLRTGQLDRAALRSYEEKGLRLWTNTR